jgi:hypothetical protein
MANGRCRIHGGQSPSGLDSATILEGHTSSKIPHHLDNAYHRILKDPNLLSLQKDVAVAESHLEELAKDLDLGWDYELTHVVLTLCESLSIYLQSDKGQYVNMPDDFAELLAELLDRVAERSNPQATWEQIKDWTKHKSHLVRTEQHVLQQQKLNITAEQAKLLLNAVVHGMLQEVAVWKGQVLALLSSTPPRIAEARQMLQKDTIGTQIAIRVRQLITEPNN